MTLLLSHDDLEHLLSLPDVIDAVEAAFLAYSSGKTVTPARGSVAPPGTGGVLLSMPAAILDPPALGTKLVTVYPDNPACGLPTLASLYVLADYGSGVPLAVMDGTWLTAARTAAGSAVATRHLARADARTLGIFGTGVQARFHARALQCVRPLDCILVAGTSRAKEASFAQWVEAATGIAAAPAAPAEVSAAGLVACCTTSATPVVLAEAVAPGAHVNAVGAFTPATRELPSALVARAAIYVDTRAGALAEAGDLLIPQQEGALDLSRIRGEIGELLLGRAPGRESEQEVTIYKTVGAAFLDAALARLAYDRAVAAGAGQQFRFA